MSEKQKPEVKISIVTTLGGALIGISKGNGEPKIGMVKPDKQISWLQRRKMKRIPATGKK